jgi:hypothetical protein
MGYKDRESRGMLQTLMKNQVAGKELKASQGQGKFCGG